MHTQYTCYRDGTRVLKLYRDRGFSGSGRKFEKIQRIPRRVIFSSSKFQPPNFIFYFEKEFLFSKSVRIVIEEYKFGVNAIMY